MNLNAVKGMMEDMLEDIGWHIPGPEPQVQKFNKRIKTVPGIDNSSDATFKSIKTGIEQIENLDRSRSRFMTACDTCYPRQYLKQEGYFPRHYSEAKSTPPKKKVEPVFQEREKSDAGKLADKFTELLKRRKK